MHHDFVKIDILAILSRGLSLSFYHIIRYVASVVAHYEENRLCDINSPPYYLLLFVIIVSETPYLWTCFVVSKRKFSTE